MKLEYVLDAMQWWSEMLYRRTGGRLWVMLLLTFAVFPGLPIAIRLAFLYL